MTGIQSLVSNVVSGPLDVKCTRYVSTLFSLVHAASALRLLEIANASGGKDLQVFIAYRHSNVESDSPLKMSSQL